MHVNFPDWLRRRASRLYRDWNGPDAATRMRLAIELADENVTKGTGGPFGAIITDRSGRLLGLGVNLVTTQRCALLHAEMVALMTAQHRLNHYHLDEAADTPTLTASVDPCAMCFGALVWSRIRRLECGATTADAEAIGFDEGPKPRGWVASLEHRGIRVSRPLQRTAAAAVLNAYAGSGAPRY